MVSQEVDIINDLCLSGIMITLYIISLVITSNYFYKKMNKIPNIIKRATTIFILCHCLYYLSIIIFDMSRLDKLKNDDWSSKQFYYISLIIFYICNLFAILSLNYVLLLRFIYCFKDTFLATNEIFIQIIFFIFVVSLLFYIIGYIIYNCIIFWYPNIVNKNGIDWYIIPYYTFTIIFKLIIMFVMNLKLYQFIKISSISNKRLSKQSNIKWLNHITKQTTLMSLIVITRSIFYILQFLYFGIKTNTSNRFHIFYDYSWFLSELIVLFSILFNFNFTNKPYHIICGCCHNLCIYFCQKCHNKFSLKLNLNHENKSLNINGSDKYGKNVTMVVNLVENTAQEFDLHSSVSMSMPISTSTTITNSNCKFTQINYIDDCHHLNAICDILLDGIDKDDYNQYGNGLLLKYLNHFHHVLQFHDNETNFDMIYDYLICNDQNKNDLKWGCDITKCQYLQRNYRHRLKNDNDDNKMDDDNILNQFIDRLHSYYYHSYDRALRIKQSEIKQEIENTNDEKNENKDNEDPDNAYYLKQENILKSIDDIITKRNDSNTNNRRHKPRDQSDTSLSRLGMREINKFNTNINPSQLKQDIDNDLFSFGYRFEYEIDDNLEQWIINKKYQSLKEETLNNDIYTIELYEWNILWAKAAQFLNSNFVLELKRDTDTDRISFAYIISLLLYCNFDVYQRKWSETYRKLQSDETDNSLKQRHSNFYHSSKFLRDFVEIYGIRLVSTESNNMKFYHGVDKELYFIQTMAQFNAPLSTSTEIQIAMHFTQQKGLILELEYYASYYPLNSKYLPCTFFSNYLSEKECLFIGGIPVLQITNIWHVIQSKSFLKYILSLNLLDLIMNGLSEKKKSKKIIHETCLSLLTNQLNTHHHQNDVQNEKFPNYVLKLFNQYCQNKKNILIIWSDTFELEQYDLIRHLICIRGDHNSNSNKCIFFNLEILSVLFPELKWIEFYNHRISSQRLTAIFDYLLRYIVQITKKSNNIDWKLEYIVIHHKISKQLFENLQTLFNDIHTTNWNIIQDKGKTKTILYKQQNNDDFDINKLEFKFYERNHGSATDQLVNKHIF